MPKTEDQEKAIIDDIKFGALAVINRELEDAISAGTDPKKWTPEEKMKYFLVLEVQDEILRRVDLTFRSMRKEKRSRK